MCVRILGGLFSALLGIQTPKAPAPAPAPTQDTEAVRKAAEDERRRQRLAAGRNSTILTGASQLEEANPAAPKTLLGG